MFSPFVPCGVWRVKNSKQQNQQMNSAVKLYNMGENTGREQLILDSQSCSVMLKIKLNRLKPQAEKIIAEEQAGFRAGRSTTEHFDRNASSILFGEVYVFYVCCQSSTINSLWFFWVFLELKKKTCFTQVKCSSNNSRSI